MKGRMIDRKKHRKLCDDLLGAHPDLVEALEEQKEFERQYFAELAEIGPIEVPDTIFYTRKES